MNISYDQAQLSKMKIPQLKELCVEFKLKKSGKKDILIDRILQHTSHNPIEKTTPETTMDLEFENRYCLLIPLGSLIITLKSINKLNLLNGNWFHLQKFGKHL